MGKKLIVPTEEEDRVITAAAEADPDNPPLGDALLDQIRRARRGRPALPDEARRRRVSVMLDPEVVAALRKAGGNTSARVNRLLRKDLGI